MRDWSREPPTKAELAAFANEPLRLRFDTVDDARNYGLRVAERGNYMLAAQSLDIAKGYEEGRLDLAVNWKGHDPEHFECELLVHRIPIGLFDRRGQCSEDTLAGDLGFVLGTASECGGNEQAMLVYVPQLVKTPKGEVASFVRLKGSDQLDDGGINATAFPLNVAFQFRLGIAEGELSGAEVPALEHCRARVDGLVKRGAQGRCRSPKQHSRVRGQRPFELYGMRIERLLRIELTAMSVLASLNEIPDDFIETIDIVPRICDEQSRAVERAFAEHMRAA